MLQEALMWMPHNICAMSAVTGITLKGWGREWHMMLMRLYRDVRKAKSLNTERAHAVNRDLQRENGNVSVSAGKWRARMVIPEGTLIGILKGPFELHRLQERANVKLEMPIAHVII